MTDDLTAPEPTGSTEELALHPETVAIRAGRSENGAALAPILWSTTTFVTPTVDEGRRLATSVGPTQFYGRYGNPTVRAFEDAIAQLEGAESARAFASGTVSYTHLTLPTILRV